MADKRYRNTYTQAVSIWHARHGEKGKFKVPKKGTPEYQKVLEIKKEIDEGKIAKSLYTAEEVEAKKAKRKPRPPRARKAPTNTDAAAAEAVAAPIASIAPTNMTPQQTIETKPEIVQPTAEPIKAPAGALTPPAPVAMPDKVEADIAEAMEKLLTAKKNRRATKKLNEQK